MKRFLSLNLLPVLLMGFFSVLHAQETATDSTAVNKEAVIKLTAEQEKNLRLAQLEKIIREEETLLSTLKSRAKRLTTPDAELNAEIEQKTRDVAIVNKSFEQIAVGSSSLDFFKPVEAPKDWQEELTLVIKPLLENLRSLTEKPRKRDNLRQEIIVQKDTIETASEALESIDELVADTVTEKSVDNQLMLIRSKWQHRLTEAERKQELATIELSNLNGDSTDWFESGKESLKQFARERGLTLLIAIIVAVLVVLFFRGLTKFLEYRRSHKKRTVNHTTYRIIAYAQRILTGLFVVIGVVVVFSLRGDVLLLAISAILIVASALGLRHFLPQFLDESRILLNIGSVREHELVIVNGVPWRVASINMHSKLINPEIKGVLRLPLDQMMGLVSRQISDEKWFPSSIGDWVLDDDNKLYEVIGQGPDAVELQSGQGSNKLVPTGTYYAAGFVNLTKSKGIRITSVFGVDYSLQKICLDIVPEKMQKAVQEYLENSDLGTTDIKTRVEFQQAGESSLDYKVIVNINSSASSHYYRIQRYIQQACVSVCNQESWGIPFPQITVHKADD